MVVERTPEEIKGIEDAAREFWTVYLKQWKFQLRLLLYIRKIREIWISIFSGADMGMLIGKRGQTLDSLQYLTSLVVNKGQEHYIRVKLDTENYRSRRKRYIGKSGEEYCL